MILRILASIILLISVLFWPFWLSVLLGVVGMVYFSLFWEAVVLFLLSDLLYGVGEAQYFGVIFISFLASAIFLIALEFFKKKLKFYNK